MIKDNKYISIVDILLNQDPDENSNSTFIINDVEFSLSKSQMVELVHEIMDNYVELPHFRNTGEPIRVGSEIARTPRIVKSIIYTDSRDGYLEIESDTGTELIEFARPIYQPINYIANDGEPIERNQKVYDIKYGTEWVVTAIALEVGYDRPITVNGGAARFNPDELTHVQPSVDSIDKIKSEANFPFKRYFKCEYSDCDNCPYALTHNNMKPFESYDTFNCQYAQAFDIIERTERVVEHNINETK